MQIVESKFKLNMLLIGDLLQLNSERESNILQENLVLVQKICENHGNNYWMLLLVTIGMSEEFYMWLDNVSAAFLLLCTNEKEKTVCRILQLCNSQELLCLTQNILPSLLCTDFLRLLPLDISHHIVSYLDFRTSLLACQVSKTWMSIVESCNKLWKRVLEENGIIISKFSKENIKLYKQWLIQHLHLMNNGKIVREIHQVDRKTSFPFDRICDVKNENFAALVDDGRKLVYGSFNEACVEHQQTNYSVFHLNYFSRPRIVSIGQKYIYLASMNDIASFHMDSSQLYMEYHGHVRSVTSLDADCNVGLLLSASGDQTIKLWNVHTSNMIFSSGKYQCHSTWVIVAKFLNNLDINTKVFVSLDKLHCLNVWCAKKDENTSLCWRVFLVHSICNDSGMNTPVSDNIHKVPFPMKDDSGFYFVQSKEYKNSNIYTILACFVQEVHSSVETSINYVQEIEIDNTNLILSILGVGKKFLIFRDDKPSVKVLDLQRGQIILSFSTELNSKFCTYKLEVCDWLDGFQEPKNCIYFCTSLNNSSICRFRLCNT